MKKPVASRLAKFRDPEPPTPVKPKGTTKKTHPKHSPRTRALVLTIVELCGNNEHLAAAITGIPRPTLREWRKSLTSDEAAKIKEKLKGTVSAATVIATCIETLAGLVAIKARKATMIELTYAMALLINPNIAVNERVEAAAIERPKRGPRSRAVKERMAIVPVAFEPIPLPTKPPEPVPVDGKKEKWEKVLKQVLADGASREPPMTEREARQLVIDSRPEAARYLRIIDVDSEVKNESGVM